MLTKILFYIYLIFAVFALGQRYGFIPLDSFYVYLFCRLPIDICYFTNPFHKAFIDFFRFLGEWAFVPLVAVFILSILIAISSQFGFMLDAKGKTKDKDSNL